MKPLIGITADIFPDPANERTRGKIQLNANYAQCVADAGGIPIVIPPHADPKELAKILDGLLIPGGKDIDAKNWGEENHPAVNPIARERYDLESSLVEHAHKDMPVLGICYGCQFLSVQRGGSLIQHLPDILGHNDDETGVLQQYSVDEGSKLAGIVGGRVEGKSYHHQAIREPGEGMRVTAMGSDGIIEAIEAEDRPWMVGVQWHPERTMDDDKSKRLFREFVAAALRYKEAK